MKKLFLSFRYAISGLYTVMKKEQNMRIHLLAVFVVSISGFFLELSAIEWTAVVLAIGLVMVTETINTAIELLVDLISPEYNKQAGKIKDISAGAVLLSAIISTVVAIYIFGNKIFNVLL